MHFPKFWQKASEGGFSCWGWSDSSLSDAESKARELVRNVANRFASGQLDRSQIGPDRNSYEYPKRPLREEIVKSIDDGSNGPVCVLTRNSYGALILNTAKVIFVDIDIPEIRVAGGIGQFIAKLFGKKSELNNPDPLTTIRERISEWAKRNTSFGANIYRTKAGVRVLVTSATGEPDSPYTTKLFEALGADPLYQRLCKDQKSFRARLTPKPWRCGVLSPPVRWPWESAEIENKYRVWERGYAAACESYATCKLLEQVGNKWIHQDVDQILKLHDEQTRARVELPLA